jgi:hypothetical protein
MRFLWIFIFSVLFANFGFAGSEVLRPVAKAVQKVEAPKPKSERGVLRPAKRPKTLGTSTLAKSALKRTKPDTRGRVCKDRDIQGSYVGRVPAKVRGCGLDNAVKVTSISGVRLSQSATMDCTTARTLKDWVNKGAKKTIGKKGGGLAELHVVAHYACRPRNNKKGAKISEHGRGRAVDIAGFTLHNGQSFSVLKDWYKSKWSNELRQMHKAACGPFGTVLGPQANKYHKDHFHFDTARYRSGSYCK